MGLGLCRINILILLTQAFFFPQIIILEVDSLFFVFIIESLYFHSVEEVVFDELASLGSSYNGFALTILQMKS